MLKSSVIAGALSLILLPLFSTQPIPVVVVGHEWSRTSYIECYEAQEYTERYRDPPANAQEVELRYDNDQPYYVYVIYEWREGYAIHSNGEDHHPEDPLHVAIFMGSDPAFPERGQERVRKIAQRQSIKVKASAGGFKGRLWVCEMKSTRLWDKWAKGTKLTAHVNPFGFVVGLTER